MGIEVIITAVAGLFTTVGTSFATWFFSRRKYNSEVDQNNIANMQKSLDFYRTLSDDYRKRLSDEIASHNREVAELKQENAELKKELREQEKRFDERLLAQQREITLMKNQMLSVYSQVCMNFNCLDRRITKPIPADSKLSVNKKSRSKKPSAETHCIEKPSEA